jgi:general secretion pathway protein G
MAMMHECLQPYVKSRDIFRCPSDSGYDVEDFTGVPLDARPTSFQKFGTSYNYRTEITFRRMTEGSFRSPSEVNVMFDASGRWHGGLVVDTMRYDVLHADGHAKNLHRDQVQALWAMPL